MKKKERPPAHPLRQFRQRIGIETQGEFAETIGYDRCMVSLIENYLRPMSAAFALAVSDVYGRDMERLGFTVEEFLRGHRITRRRGRPYAAA